MKRVERLLYGRLVLEECSRTPDEKTCEELLTEALRSSWPGPFKSAEELRQYGSRVRLIKETGIRCHFPDLEGEEFEALLRHICRGKRSFDEIASQSLDGYIESMQSPEARRALAALTPQRIQIGCNRKALVHYEEGKKPWVASRLQDFFGVTETPRIGGGKVPLVVHLCGPGGQVVQVTSDLESFWRRCLSFCKKRAFTALSEALLARQPCCCRAEASGTRKQKTGKIAGTAVNNIRTQAGGSSIQLRRGLLLSI